MLNPIIFVSQSIKNLEETFFIIPNILNLSSYSGCLEILSVRKLKQNRQYTSFPRLLRSEHFMSWNICVHSICALSWTMQIATKYNIILRSSKLPNISGRVLDSKEAYNLQFFYIITFHISHSKSCFNRST
jgi:hypothetical protein